MAVPSIKSLMASVAPDDTEFQATVRDVPPRLDPLGADTAITQPDAGRRSPTPEVTPGKGKVYVPSEALSTQAIEPVSRSNA